MKKMNKLTVAALALTAISLAYTTASAQSVSPGANDLILGFQLQGSNTDLEVDLGAASNFTAGSYINLTADLSAADLNSISSSWASTTPGTGVNWSVAGVNADGSSIYATSIAGANNVRTSSASGLATAQGLIASLASGSAGAGSLNGAPVAGTASSALIGGTVNSVNSGGVAASALSESYQSLEGGNGYSFVPSAEQTGAGTDELYSFTPGTTSGFPPKYPLATDLGTFTLSDTGGNLSFTFGTPAAVPEPSAYALGLCAMLLFWVLKRRRSVA